MRNFFPNDKKLYISVGGEKADLLQLLKISMKKIDLNTLANVLTYKTYLSTIHNLLAKEEVSTRGAYTGEKIVQYTEYNMLAMSKEDRKPYFGIIKKEVQDWYNTDETKSIQREVLENLPQ